MSDTKIWLELSRERYMALVLRGLAMTKIVTLTVDAAVLGVVLPPQFVDGEVTLNYGLDLVVPIPDLRVDLAGVLATLSFGRVPHETFAPWSAVRQIDFDPMIYSVATAQELDSIAAEHLRGLKPLSVPQDKPRRLRRITQLDVFSPEDVEVDPAATSREFAARGLRAVK